MAAKRVSGYSVKVFGLGQGFIDPSPYEDDLYCDPDLSALGVDYSIEMYVS